MATIAAVRTCGSADVILAKGLCGALTGAPTCALT